MLNDTSRAYPGAWKQASEMRRDRTSLPTWPDWCYLPIAGWLSIALHSMGKSHPTLMDIYPAQLLAALGPWRYTQGIYRFTPALYDALRDTVPHGDMPIEVLYRLPEWSLYIETPGMDWVGQPVDGFFAHLEHDANTSRPELRFLVVPTDNNAPCTAISLHIGAWTVTEAIDRSFTIAAKRGGLGDDPHIAAYTEECAKSAYPMMSLLLYLCSDEPELVDYAAPGDRPKRPRPTRVKGGWELFPAKKPHVWTIGEEINQRLEHARRTRQESVDRKGPIAHIRRAHWHGYWTGTQKTTGGDQRRFRYRWLPPIIVGAKDND